jgi:hypothetical protein
MFFKIYFWVFAISLTGFFKIGFDRIWEVFDFASLVFVLLGLFGFTWGKKIFSGTFWKLFFPLILMWNIFYFYFIPLPEAITTQAPWMSQEANALITFILAIPAIWALYSYGFSKDHLWK